jgi:hypothetical protein
MYQRYKIKFDSIANLQEATAYLLKRGFIWNSDPSNMPTDARYLYLFTKRSKIPAGNDELVMKYGYSKNVFNHKTKMFVNVSLEGFMEVFYPKPKRTADQEMGLIL